MHLHLDYHNSFLTIALNSAYNCQGNSFIKCKSYGGSTHQWLPTGCNNQPKACMTSVVRGSLPPLPWGHAPITLWTGLTHSPSFPSAKVGACSLASGLPSQTKSAALSPRPTPGHTPLLSAPAAPALLPHNLCTSRHWGIYR